MPALAETQGQFRRAIAGAAELPATLLVAPAPLAGRLEIYRRHYREGLTRHLVGRFPTIEWVLGSPRLVPLAEAYSAAHPPAAPCLAEYGEGFVAFLATSPAAATLPWRAPLAQLDWHLGTVSVAIDHPPLAISALADWPADRLPDLGLALQPGLHYLAASWPIDDLVRIRLGPDTPAELAFVPSPVQLEIRGARGRFAMHRRDPARFAFRGALAGGATLGAAIAPALAADPHFDIAAGLAALFAETLVTAIIPPVED